MNKLPLKYASVAVLLAAVILAVLLATGRLGPSALALRVLAPVQVSVAPVSLIDKETPLALTGTVEDSKATIVTAQIAGRISEIFVNEGQVVKTGQPLAKIETTGQVVPRPADPAGAVGASGASGAQAAYDSALKDYNRYQKLYEIGGIARRQVETAAARLQAAREALAAAPAGPGPGQSSGGQPPAGPVELTAAFGGTVTGLTAAVGQTVLTGQQLMVLQNAGEVRIVSHLTLKDIYLVRSGTPVQVTVADAPGRTFTGRVEAIYPEIGTTPPTFRAHIQVDNPGGLLKAGMTANLSLSTGQGAIVHAVPAAAIVREQGLSYLFVLDDGKAVRHQVTTGAVSGDYIEITSDLPLGTLVVTGGDARIKDGDQLELQ